MANDESRNTAKDDAETLERLQAAYDAFLDELGVLKHERAELVKKILERGERDKIKDLMKSLQ